MKKSIIISFLLIIFFLTPGYLKPDVYKIDASKNATLHNNLGLNAVEDKNYYSAIEEFSLAIELNPNTQATAVYYNNLGETYMKTGCFKEAQKCFEQAIKQYNFNFLYYQNLTESFKAQKILKQKIEFYEKNESKTPLNMVILGLLYVKEGDVKRGIIKLDEFCMKEPYVLITSAVRNYIKDLVLKK